jgi:hypothetical protein
MNKDSLRVTFQRASSSFSAELHGRATIIVVVLVVVLVVLFRP